MRSAFRHYLTKKLIRNVLQVTRRCSNVSGTSGKLLEEDVTTYQEHLASYLKKMLQRSRHVLHVTWRRYDNESGTSWKLLEEDVTTYQERLASDLTEMLPWVSETSKFTNHKFYLNLAIYTKIYLNFPSKCKFTW